ncbi:MAG: hypothetical protein KTR20_05950 [Cellvibrionaceae bacterium]|nr:hypothetical protein [Cellvibrionaceae bacterium]
MANKQHRRSPAETLWLHLLLHVGFSKPLLAEAHLRKNAESFGKRSIERANEQIKGRLAYQIYKWPTRPTNKVPGKGVTSNAHLIEMSLLAAAMYHLYGDKIYEQLEMKEIIEAYDLYTNIHKTAGGVARQISPDTAYWLAREFVSYYAVVPYCPNCKVRYYSSVEQKIKNACPFCKTAGVDDFNSLDKLVSHGH